MTALLTVIKVLGVFALLGAVLWALKRTDGLGVRPRGRVLEVRCTTKLAKGASLTVVRVDGQDLLLGVTDHAVTLLSSTTPEPEVAPEGAPAGGTSTSLPQLLDQVLTYRADVPDHQVVSMLSALRGSTSPSATDGPVDPTRSATRWPFPRTDARRFQEHPWTRARRHALHSSAERDAVP